MARQPTRTTIEIPRDLLPRLREQAERESRTMTAVITRALEFYIYHQAKKETDA